jgi:putative PIN family toxin of toxin-antitoxin system
MSLRVVFDTNTVLSALLFDSGRLAWLRQHWRHGTHTPLACRETVLELTRVLAYPKFRLTPQDREELLTDYLPFCELIRLTRRCPAKCRDSKDQPFLDLAQSGNIMSLITGDRDLLALAGKTSFSIETPESYRQRVEPR